MPAIVLSHWIFIIHRPNNFRIGCRIFTSASALKLGVIHVSLFCFRFFSWAIFTTLLLPWNNRVLIKKTWQSSKFDHKLVVIEKRVDQFRVNHDNGNGFQFDYVVNFWHPPSLIFPFGNNISHLLKRNARFKTCPRSNLFFRSRLCFSRSVVWCIE